MSLIFGVFLHSRTHGSSHVGVELGGVGLLVVLGPVELLHVGLEVDGVTRRGEKTSGPPSLAIRMKEEVVWSLQREGREADGGDAPDTAVAMPPTVAAVRGLTDLWGMKPGSDGRTAPREMAGLDGLARQ